MLKGEAAVWHKNIAPAVAPYLVAENITTTHRMYTDQYGIDPYKERFLLLREQQAVQLFLGL